MSRTVSKLEYFALDKPWMYLSIISLAVMMIIVAMGNPLLPVPELSKIGWSWHHIPEIMTFLFLGMWWSELRIHNKIHYALTIIISTVFALSYIFSMNITDLAFFGVLFSIAFLIGAFIVLAYKLLRQRQQKQFADRHRKPTFPSQT